MKLNTFNKHFYIKAFFIILSIFSFLLFFNFYSITLLGSEYFINRISIHGNSTISNEEICSHLKISENEIYPIETLIDIQNLLVSWGYFNLVEVDFEIIDNNEIIKKIQETYNTANLADLIIINIIITLAENKIVNSYRLINSSINLLNIEKKLKIQEGKAFNPPFLEHDLAFISKLPYITRVSSQIIESDLSLDIKIIIEYQNKSEYQFSMQNFIETSFSYEIGKVYFPIILSFGIFYPFDKESLTPSISFGIGLNVLPCLEVYMLENFLFQNNFDTNYQYGTIFGSSLKGLLINSDILKLDLNPLSVNINFLNDFSDYSFNMRTDIFLKAFNFVSLYFSSIYHKNSYGLIKYGNSPNSNNSFTISNYFLSSPYFYFLYPEVIPFRFMDNISSITGLQSFSFSSDLLIHIFSISIVNTSLICSCDLIKISGDKNILLCYGLGLLFSIGVPGVVSVPLSIQYFWDKDFIKGIVKFTFLAKRFT